MIIVGDVWNTCKWAHSRLLSGRQLTNIQLLISSFWDPIPIYLRQCVSQLTVHRCSIQTCRRKDRSTGCLRTSWLPNWWKSKYSSSHSRIDPKTERVTHCGKGTWRLMTHNRQSSLDIELHKLTQFHGKIQSSDALSDDWIFQWNWKLCNSISKELCLFCETDLLDSILKSRNWALWTRQKITTMLKVADNLQI